MNMRFESNPVLALTNSESFSNNNFRQQFQVLPGFCELWIRSV